MVVVASGTLVGALRTSDTSLLEAACAGLVGGFAIVPCFRLI